MIDITYLNADPTNLKQLFVNNLEQSGSGTIYPSSNWSLLLDHQSAMMSYLLFYINRTAIELSEDATIRKNVLKQIKKTNYKPLGYQGSALDFYVKNNTPDGSYIIPKLSYVRVDNQSFVLTSDLSFTQKSPTVFSSLSKNIVLVQGDIQETTFTASGLSDTKYYIDSNPSDKIDHFNFIVYVENKSTKQYQEYKRVDSILQYDSNDFVYELFFDENNTYQLSFGNGYNGQNPTSGSNIVVFYIKTSETPKTVLIGSLNSKFKKYVSANATLVGLSSNVPDIIVSNAFQNTPFVDLETVEELKANARRSFNTQGRLITKNDYQSYFAINFSRILSDFQIFDNKEYLDTVVAFYNQNGMTNALNELYSLKNLIYTDTYYPDNLFGSMIPSNPNNATTVLAYVYNSLKNKKSNGELKLIDPVPITVSLGRSDWVGAPFLEIKKNLTGSSSLIKTKAIEIIRGAFNSARLGVDVSIATLNQLLLNIDGVTGVRTRTQTKALDGLVLQYKATNGTVNYDIFDVFKLNKFFHVNDVLPNLEFDINVV